MASGPHACSAPADAHTQHARGGTANAMPQHPCRCPPTPTSMATRCSRDDRANCGNPSATPLWAALHTTSQTGAQRQGGEPPQRPPGRWHSHGALQRPASHQAVAGGGLHPLAAQGVQKMGPQKSHGPSGSTVLCRLAPRVDSRPRG